MPVIMFAPAATLAHETKPVQQPQRTMQPNSNLVIALAKLTLQHEQERQNRARSENVVLQASVSHPMMQRLEAMVEMYDREGKTARANQGDQYVGHTQGKRPDALFRGVLYRLAENVRENQQVIEQRLQTEEMVAAALKRVLKVGEQAAQNRDLKALRCFRVKSKDETEQDIVRWIFAPSRQRQQTEDLWTLREVAPRTKAAKQVQQLAFGTVPTSTKNQRTRGKSANARARPGTRRIDYALFCATWRELTHFPSTLAELAIWTSLRVTLWQSST